MAEIAPPDDLADIVPQEEVEEVCRALCARLCVDPDQPTYVGLPRMLPNNRYAPNGPATPMWATYSDLAFSALKVVKERGNG